jgi:predicted TIM-barrel fold metal-dependent hydrolase
MLKPPERSVAVATEAPQLVDAEHHYYEPDDCFTRHLESQFRDRALHVVNNAAGERHWVFGERPMSKASFARDRVLPPGAYGERKPGNPFPPEVDAHSEEFTSRSKRLTLMDEQDTRAVLMLPSMVIHVEHDLRADVPAAYANLRSFNRWLEEEWGYAYDARIFSVPYIALFDVNEAVAELERVLALGARAVMIKSGPVNGKSPGHHDLDTFWSRLNESGVPLVMHLDNGGYTEFFSAAWGEQANPDERHVTPFQWATCFGSRPFQDTLAQLILWNVFGRFEHIRLLSMSNGCDWIPSIMRLNAFADPTFPYAHDDATWWPGGKLSMPPSEILRSRVWVAPFVYENLPLLCEQIGYTQILMASDYPHPEGFADARSFRSLVTLLPEVQQRAILHDNLAALLCIA